jgi:predicted ArsR family transcriptional regulator
VPAVQARRGQRDAPGRGPREGRRSEVLATLRAATGPLSIVQVAGRLGVHVNTARLHLDALVDSGQAERVTVDRSGPGRPPLMFRARAGMDPTGPRSYRMLATVLVDSLGTEPDAARRAIEVGQAWGRQAVKAGPSSAARTSGTALTRLMVLLDDIGFEPQRRTRERRTQVALRNCPFLELAQTRAAVVCPLHLGLMQGAVAEMGGAVTVERLVPFAEPDLCVTHLTLSGTATGDPS